MKQPEFKYCISCQQVIGVINDSFGTPTCCGQPMRPCVPNGNADADKAAETPVAKRDGNKLHVEIPHPEEPRHYIEWIAVSQQGRTQRVEIGEGNKPVADFVIVDGPAEVYSYCNRAGLWMSAID